MGRHTFHRWGATKADAIGPQLRKEYIIESAYRVKATPPVNGRFEYVVIVRDRVK